MRDFMISAPATTGASNRVLRADDLDRVIAIDRAHTGRVRRHFFERRFAAAEAHPEDFIQIGLMRGGALRGFVFARLLRGEFGREHLAAVLDAIGVELESQEQGVGQSLMEELVSKLRAIGARSLHSQAEWTDPDLLRFFAAIGFKLAPRLALERSVTEPLIEQNEDA
jgi:N-acetylglutamate synthase-like GNAT family acetyltransferase